MDDLLYLAAKKYKELKHTSYVIHLGSKNKIYKINLKFRESDFSHLAGLQYLKDFEYRTRPKAKLFQDIIQKKITLETLQSSVFFEETNIEDRLRCIMSIEDILDANTMTFLINRSITRIQADYIFKHEHIMEDMIKEIMYLFIIENGKECNCCSTFIEHGKDYTYKAQKTKILYIKKIVFENNNNVETVIYKSQTYKGIK